MARPPGRSPRCCPAARRWPSYFLPNNRGKKSVTVDLNRRSAKQQILGLVDTADVVLESFRPGVMERMGLGPERTCSSRNPKLIYARLSAFGGNGPNGNRPGVDLMVAAEAGMTTGMRTPDGKPQIIPFQLVDNASGHVLAQAVLAALLNRERHGVADVVEVAMYDVAVALQANQLTDAPEQAQRGAQAEIGPAAGTRGQGAQGSWLRHPALGRVPHRRRLPRPVSAYIPKHWDSCARSSAGRICWTTNGSPTSAPGSLNYPELTDELETTLATKTSAQWVESVARTA